MPCNDVTEILELALDNDDRLHHYRLFKRTCGRAVGEESLLLESLAGQTAPELLALTADEFADRHDRGDEEWLFLQLKHFFALQSGLRALTGDLRAGILDPVRVARVGYDGEHTTLEAEIVVDVVVEQIKACGRCKGCGVLKLAKKLDSSSE